MHTYHAKLVRVIDGDTIVVDLDLGRSTWIHDDILRLAHINAPEMRGPTREAGLVSRDELSRFLADRDLKVHTIKNRKGKEKKTLERYVAEVWILVGDKEFSVNDWMVAQGLAVYQNY